VVGGDHADHAHHPYVAMQRKDLFPGILMMNLEFLLIAPALA